MVNNYVPHLCFYIDHTMLTVHVSMTSNALGVHMCMCVFMYVCLCRVDSQLSVKVTDFGFDAIF